MSADIEIRSMTRSDLDTAIAWAGTEGWNPGLADGDCFYAADPQGFLAAFENQTPVACISAIAYGSDYGFIGFYICRPDRRGQGIGYRVWQAGLSYLAGRTIGLDGVIDQQDNYRKEGFALAHRNVRYGGRVDCDAPDDPRLQSIGAEEIEALLAYDRPFFPAPREAFLRCWLQTSAERSGYALISDGDVAGYGVLRRCAEGFKVGPLFAETARDADLLFRALAAKTGGEDLYLDPPQSNDEGVALARRYGLEPVFETARMYRGPAPDLPLERIFGITTFELG